MSASTGRRTVNEICGARRTDHRRRSAPPPRAGCAESYRRRRANQARVPGVRKLSVDIKSPCGHWSTAHPHVPDYINIVLINFAYTTPEPACVRPYRVSQKKETSYSCQYLRQILIDFKVFSARSFLSMSDTREGSRLKGAVTPSGTLSRGSTSASTISKKIDLK